MGFHKLDLASLLSDSLCPALDSLVFLALFWLVESCSRQVPDCCLGRCTTGNHVRLYIWRRKPNLAIQINTWNNFGDQKVIMELCHVIGEGLNLSLLSPNERRLLELAEKEDNQHTGFYQQPPIRIENNIVTPIWCVLHRNGKYSEATFLSYLGHDLIQWHSSTQL